MADPQAKWYPNLSAHPHDIQQFGRIVFDNLYYLRDQLGAITSAPKSLTLQQITEVRQNLQIGGAAPIDLTGLLGGTGQPQIAEFMQGAYAARPTVNTGDNGLVYYAIDQDVYYQVIVGVWKYAFGMMRGTISPDHKPALGSSDFGFLFYSTDFNRTYRWTGAAWADAPGEDPRCEVRLFDGVENPPAAGWHVCDGSTVSRSTATGGITNVTLPDYNTAAYLKAAVVATVGPTASSGQTTDESSHTHPVDPPSTASGGPSGDIGALIGVTIQAASPSHTHDTDIPSFNSGAGTVHHHGPNTLELRNSVLKAYYRL